MPMSDWALPCILKNAPRRWHSSRQMGRRRTASPMADHRAAWRAGRSIWHSTGCDVVPWRAIDMPPRRKQSHGWVYLIWGINGLAIISIIVGFSIFSRTSLRASAANAATGTPRPGETRKIPPTSYFLPTLTPNPYYTPPVFETSTPFVLAYGPRPAVIGFSVAGRPIEAYTF